MRKFVAILLLSFYLLSFPEARQLLKVSNLVEHYISHELRDGNTSLLSFFRMHYFNGHQVDGDYSQDMNLPFKKLDFSFSAFYPLSPPKQLDLSFERQIFFLVKQQSFGYAESYYPSVSQSIWQPPKI